MKGLGVKYCLNMKGLGVKYCLNMKGLGVKYCLNMKERIGVRGKQKKENKEKLKG